MLTKLKVASSQVFYLKYCDKAGVDPRDFASVLESMKRHTWSCFYWYKQYDSHFRHIDNYGELATFLVLSELGRDYESGGLVLYRNRDDTAGKCLGQHYKLGDLVIFDQARFEHEVLPIQKTKDQIGRLQYYIPSIPYGYMDELIAFEDFEQHLFRTTHSVQNIDADRRRHFQSRPIHYSRLNYFKSWS